MQESSLFTELIRQLSESPLPWWRPLTNVDKARRCWEAFLGKNCCDWLRSHSKCKLQLRRLAPSRASSSTSSSSTSTWRASTSTSTSEISFVEIISKNHTLRNDITQRQHSVGQLNYYAPAQRSWYCFQSTSCARPSGGHS